MRIDEDSTDLTDAWMGDLLSMSDQADGLRQLVQAAIGLGVWGDGASRSSSRSPVHRNAAADTNAVAGPDQRQGGRGDIEPGAEPGGRPGRAGRTGGAGGCRPRSGQHRPALRAAPATDLGDVLAGDRPLAEAIVEGPAGIRIVPGRIGIADPGRGPRRRPLAWSPSWRSLRPRPTSCWWTQARGWVRHHDAGGSRRRGGAGNDSRANLGGRCACGDQPAPAPGRPSPLACGRQPGGVGGRGQRRPGPAHRVEPAVPRDGRDGSGACPG